jgi:hypothetical protein
MEPMMSYSKLQLSNSTPLDYPEGATEKATEVN